MSFTFFPNPTPILPALSGVTYPVKKSPTFATVSAKSISGRVLRGTRQAFPLWEFELEFAFLRDQTPNQTVYTQYTGLTEWEQLATLFGACRGQYGQFYLEDPDDNSRLGVPLVTAGTGAGATTSIPTTSGNVLTFSAVPGTTAIGQYLSNNNHPTSILQGTYITRFTSTTVTMNNPVASTVSSGDNIAFVTPNQSFLPTTDGTTNIFVPLRTWGGIDANSFDLTTFEPIGGIKSLDAIHGTAITVANVGGWDGRSIYLASPPAAGLTLTCDLHFYYRCRFTEDEIQWEEFMENLSKGTIKFRTVKP